MKVGFPALISGSSCCLLNAVLKCCGICTELFFRESVCSVEYENWELTLCYGVESENAMELVSIATAQFNEETVC